MALRGAALCLRRATSGPHDVPGRNLLSQFADYAMQKGGEDGWVRVPGLVFLGVNFCPPGLHVLVVGDIIGWTVTHIHSVQGGVTHADWSIASFREALDWLQFAYTADWAGDYENTGETGHGAVSCKVWY